MRDLDWKIISELYKNPNLTQVAKVLFVTQPTLTKRLKHIEEEFGTQIVDRTPKGLEFTSSGIYLAQKADQYLQFRREVFEGLEEIERKQKETLNLGSAYTFSKFNLHDVLDPFADRHPNLTYHIFNKQSDLLYNMLLDNAIDAAFVRGDYTQGVEKIRLAPTKGYILTKNPVDQALLPSMNRVMFQTSKKTTELLDKWWKDWFGDVPWREGSNAGYIEFAIRNIVNDDEYILCFLPEGEEKSLSLSAMPLVMRDGTDVTRQTWFIYRGEKRISRIMEEFINYIETEVAEKT